MTHLALKWENQMQDLDFDEYLGIQWRYDVLIRTLFVEKTDSYKKGLFHNLDIFGGFQVI